MAILSKYHHVSTLVVIVIETLVSVAWAVLSLLGLLGVLVIKDSTSVTFSDSFTAIQGFSISTQILWWLLGSILFITCVDFSSRFSMDEDLKQIKRKGD